MRKFVVLFALAALLLAAFPVAAFAACPPPCPPPCEKAVGKVTGGGEQMGLADQKWSYSFVAISTSADGDAKGQMELQGSGEYRIHAEVLYLSVDPSTSTAWIGLVITKSTFPGIDPGEEFVVACQDNGEGANAAPDLTSDGYLRPASDALLQPLIADFEWRNGNVQFH